MDDWLIWRPFDTWDLMKGAEFSWQRFLFRYFEVRHPVVVLANGNKAECEVNVEECQRLGIPILRRKGGGGTVCLTPGCMVFSAAFYAKDLFGNALYFSLLNQLFIDAICSHRPGYKVEQRGISDLAIGGRKIAGTSLFRRKHYVGYQGSLLVDPDLDLICRTLKHPSKEPDYRQQRSHRSFLTSLRECGETASVDLLVGQCHDYTQEHASRYLMDQLVEPL